MCGFQYKMSSLTISQNKSKSLERIKFRINNFQTKLFEIINQKALMQINGIYIQMIYQKTLQTMLIQDFYSY